MLKSKREGEQEKNQEGYRLSEERGINSDGLESGQFSNEEVQLRGLRGEGGGEAGIIKLEAKYTEQPYLLSSEVPMVAQTPLIQNPFQMPVVPLKAPSRSLQNGKLPAIKIECQQQRSSSYFPLPSIFNQMGQPVFRKNHKSLRNLNKSKSQDLAILEKILYQPLNFVKSNISRQMLDETIPQRPKLRSQEDYWSSSYERNHRNATHVVQFNHGFRVENEAYEEQEGDLFQREQEQSELIRLGGESEEAVKYKIDLTYSETSRKFRQQIAIVGIRGMTFEEFLKSLKNLANFAHSSEFTLYVEKEQDLVPLLSMDQLARKKTNFLRIKSSAESSQLSDEVLAKKLNKKRKNREVIMITKLSNKEEEELN